MANDPDITLARTVVEVLDRALAAHPDREALVGRGGRLTYAELDEAANRAAHALASVGIRRGDRVAASLPNDIDIVAAFHGVARLGAVWVGINRALAPPEKAFILQDSGASVLLCDDTVAGQVHDMHVDTAPRLVVVGGAQHGDGWPRAAGGSQGASRPGIEVDPADPVGIAYTSGTTGLPKGVVHSHHNVLVPGAATVACQGYGTSLRKGDCLPFTILNLMVLTTLLVGQAGGCCVVMDRVDPDGIVEWIREERLTVWNGVPTMLHGMIANPELRRDDLASLQEVWSGGSDCPEALRVRFEEKFGIPVRSTYGLTEAPTLVAIERPGDAHVAQSSGRPLPHIQLHIVDDRGAPVAAGELGEICVGPVEAGAWAGVYRPMLGYWHQEAATAESLRGGILHTGDIGSVDGDGRLFVRDRRTLVIIRGGANVYPAEVERVLNACPGVVGSAVVGIPDERLGERVAAAVELEPGTSTTELDLTTACTRALARYKVPDFVVLVEALPRNSMGKVKRPDVQAMLEQASSTAASGGGALREQP